MIFISHSSKDKELVSAINDFLISLGLKKKEIFCSSFDGQGVKNGEKIPERIRKEINAAQIIIYLITPNFLNSMACMQEFGFSSLCYEDKYAFVFLDSEIDFQKIPGFKDTNKRHTPFNRSGLSHLLEILNEMNFPVTNKQTEITDSMDACMERLGKAPRQTSSNFTGMMDLNEFKRKYDNLTPVLKATLATLYFSSTGIAKFGISDPIIQSLQRKGFVTPAGLYGHGLGVFSFELTEEAREFIKQDKAIQKDLKDHYSKSQHQ